MAIETTLQPRQTWMNLLYAGICGVLALWGAYDYWVSIPRREEAVALYQSASAIFSELQDKASAHDAAPSVAPALTPAETAALVKAQADLATFNNEKPQPPASYDRAVQLWIYMIGCGVISTPWFLWMWIAARRQHYCLDDDGALHWPKGVVPQEEITDIDMSRWMSKSIATVKATGGRSIKLDDYKFKNMHLIVGALATRFYPDDWTLEARDRRKMEAEAAEAAAAASATTVTSS
ncbi:MAG: hypothetical protein JNK53_00700, partial [Phycisphaerae bacterium]|nr:hypothetical protein [Phycisphaerae bacterium]